MATDPAGFDPNAASAAATDPWNMTTTSLISDPGNKPTLSSGKGGSVGMFNIPVLSISHQSTAQDMMTSLYSMDAGSLRSLQKKMVDANYLDKQYVSGSADKATVNAYGLLLEDVFRYQQNPDTKDMTVGQLLDQRAEGYAASKSGAATNQTKSTVSLFSPLQAQGFLEGAYEKYLGRRPTIAELSSFKGTLNTYQQQNPNIETVHQDADNADGSNGNIADTSATNGADGAGDQAAENDALNNHADEAKTYGSNNALMMLLGHLGIPGN